MADFFAWKSYILYWKCYMKFKKRPVQTSLNQSFTSPQIPRLWRTEDQTTVFGLLQSCEFVVLISLGLVQSQSFSRLQDQTSKHYELLCIMGLELCQCVVGYHKHLGDNGEDCKNWWKQQWQPGLLTRALTVWITKPEFGAEVKSYHFMMDCNQNWHLSWSATQSEKKQPIKQPSGQSNPSK